MTILPAERDRRDFLEEQNKRDEERLWKKWGQGFIYYDWIRNCPVYELAGKKVRGIKNDTNN